MTFTVDNSAPAHGVQRSEVEKAVADAEINALRMALYQATEDPEVAAMHIRRELRGPNEVVVISDSDAQVIREKVVEFLLSGREPRRREYFGTEVDDFIQMVEARELDEDSLLMRRAVVPVSGHSHSATWSDGPVIPDGFRVAIVGGGFAGIAMASELARLGIPYRIFERSARIGGVWNLNTYPDARVDTLNSSYQYSSVKNYPWTEHFARQHEVRQYLEHVAREHGIDNHIEFDHDVRSGSFDELNKLWTLRVRSGEVTSDFTANVVVTASGLFATPRNLDTPGLDDFSGDVVHTARWNPDVDYEGKDVGIIGNGSTGVQILARIAEKARSVHVFQRTPQWIAPRPLYGEPISPELSWLVREMPYYWEWDRYVSNMGGNDLRGLLTPDDAWIEQGGQVNRRNDAMRSTLTSYISQQVEAREDLIEELVPDYAPMTRRPVVDNGWYASLIRENVRLVTDPLDRFDVDGVLTQAGEKIPLSLLVTAIGFQTERYLHPATYRGRDGKSLEDEWREKGARAYLGMTVPDFPNFFMLYGPNSQPVAAAAGLPEWFEIWAAYIGRALVTMLESDGQTVEVRRDVYEEYNEALDREADLLVYKSETGIVQKNYYMNEHGRLQVNAPWEGHVYYAMFIDTEGGDLVFDGAMLRAGVEG